MRNMVLCSLLLLWALTASAQYDRDSLRVKAESGDVESQYLLGLDYYFSDDSNEELAYSWVSKAAEENHAGAQYVLGYFYNNGVYMETDSLEARRWMQLSADNGDAEAQVWVGKDIMNKAESQEEMAEAVSWFQKAAEKNNDEAFYNLGVCYENGYGVEQNNKAAFLYYRMASKAGSSKAEEAISNFYLRRIMSLKDFLNKDEELSEETEPTDE